MSNNSDPVTRRTARASSIEPDTEAAKAYIQQWLKDHPEIVNYSVEVRKHCDGKMAVVDYEEPLPPPTE